MEHNPLNLPHALDPEQPNTDAWRALSFLNLYRFAIAGLFFVLIVTDHIVPPLAHLDPTLFTTITSIYLILSGIVGLQIRFRKPHFDIQVFTNVIADIIAITLLMHASGGVQSGLGMLMVVTIAGGSIVMAGRTALLFASLASIAILLEQAYMHLENTASTGHYAQIGLLGITFFATGGLAHLLAKRIRESEALARRRGIDLANMAQLTEYVIQRMQTGIMVVDADNQIRLINESAWNMLGMPAMGTSPTLLTVSPELDKGIGEWKINSDTPAQVFQPSANFVNVMPRFARISQDANPAVLIFLEDTSAIAQRAQKMKLAALGRLTASIAHEIRNPLGAISHAGQLLEESPHLDKSDKRLTKIIAEQSRRMNAIVENIMGLSRRDYFNPQVFSLDTFVRKFIQEFAQQQKLKADQFIIAIEPEDVEIRFDTGQLQQILTNLCENALHHSANYNGIPKLELLGGIGREISRPYLDIIDHGPGIDHETAQNIFEPFFTTTPTGTGLGLYISRELAESNQAQLNYLAGPAGGSCFRITFQDARKQIH